MAGKRHHTIPQFLIRGFASSRRGTETKVWMYRKGAKGIETNAINVGVEQYFYGKPDETDLDDRITNLEDEFARLVDNLRDSPSTISQPITDDRIPHLVAHLMIRTRQVRESASSMTGSMIGALGNHLSQTDVGTALFAKELGTEGTIRDAMKQGLLDNGLPPEKLDDVMQQLEPNWKEVAAHIMSSLGDQYKEMIAGQISAYETVRHEAIKGGFIDSLSRNLNMPERAALYAGFQWFTCSAPIPLILGDSTCIFETNGARRFRPVDADTSEVQRIYLPISTEKLLVGVRLAMKPVIDWNLLNKATARCSYEYFISSRELPAMSHLLKGLGLWAGILNKKELDDILTDVKKELS